MKIAIQHHLLPGSSLTEQFQYAAEFGFDGVEFRRHGACRLSSSARSATT
ncbi:MAG: hypothetical protein HND48_21235 [Chloroflexi bacterium]|nr:hypothetical protein [Chloroflexota bacterium]